MTNRTPPHDDELERAFLNCALLEPELPVVKQLQPEDFYSRAHQRIYEAILETLGKGLQPDILTLKAELKKAGKLEEAGGINYIDSLLKAVPSSANADYYAESVFDYAIRRNFLRVCNEISTDAYNESISARNVARKAANSINAIIDRMRAGKFHEEQKNKPERSYFKFLKARKRGKK